MTRNNATAESTVLRLMTNVLWLTWPESPAPSFELGDPMALELSVVVWGPVEVPITVGIVSVHKDLAGRSLSVAGAGKAAWSAASQESLEVEPVGPGTES
jgi:hypothetical protein